MKYLENFQKLENFKEKLEKDYNEKLIELVDDFIDELKVSQIHKNMIIDFLNNMKEHSVVTYKHSIDVAFRTYELASQYLNKEDSFYSLTEQQLGELCIAGLLHDAGKLDIPKEILEADRKLTDEEFAKMKEHSKMAEKHIKNFSKEIVDLAVHHHEKLDGSGYPDHLKFDELSLSNRIITIADITSALFQKRSYKQEFSTDKVAKILLEDMENNKLDQVVVKKMIELINQKEIEQTEIKNIDNKTEIAE